MKIGFFDSGLGGLTIFKVAIDNIDKVNEEFFYLGDNKNAPYGVKEKEQVKKYIFDNVEFLIKNGCKIIVIACNTATSIAIDELRKKYKEIIFIGTEPAVKKAVDQNLSKRILVCATSITISEGKLHNLIENLDANDIVDLISLDKLVVLAESKEDYFTSQKCIKEVLNYLKDRLKGYDINNYSYVVLGCTHFPLFKREFEKIFGADINIIDGSQGVINNLIRKVNALESNVETKKEKNNITLILTEEDEIFCKKFKEITKIKEFKTTIKN